MRIKNDFVSIKIGEKQYDFRNLIMDEYLKRFARAQLNKNDTRIIRNNKFLGYCLLKFDTSFENLTSSSEIHNQDFDICLVGGAIYSEEINDSMIFAKYNYVTDWVVWDYKKNTANEITLKDYKGRKITAIGFNSWWANDGNANLKWPVCAILDTSNYNLYLQENQNFAVTRRDIISSDALFWSNNSKVKAPAHLAPYGIEPILYQKAIIDENGVVNYAKENAFGILYSVGFSSWVDYIDKEYVIGKDVEVVNNGTELEIKGLENYLSNDNSLFPSENIYPGSNLYPIQSKYKYVILKYKLWQKMITRENEEDIYIPTDTGAYYHQAIPIENFGKSNLKIKYERS